MKFVYGGPKRFAHQTAGLRRLIETRGVCALLWDPGTAKTSTVLDYLSLLALKNGGEIRALVVAPLAAVDTWVSQSETFVSPQVSVWAEAVGSTLSVKRRAQVLADRGGKPFPKAPEPRRSRLRGERTLWAARALSTYVRRADGRPAALADGPGALPGPRLMIQSINVDSFKSRQEVGSKTMADVMLTAVERYAPDVVVIDESHVSLKGHGSNVSRLLSRIGARAPRRIILTGTVMPHSPLDVFGQWRFLAPYDFGRVGRDGKRKAATWGSFTDRYGVMGGYMGREVIGFKNLDEMQQIMSRRSMVVRKEDALDLPTLTEEVIHVRLSSAEQSAYDSMRSTLAATIGPGSTSTVPNRLAQAMRLRQITAGHLPSDQGGTRTVGTSKVDMARSVAQDILGGEDRIVVFAEFIHEIDALVDALADKRSEVLKITGETPPEQRKKMRERFGSGEKKRLIIVAQIRTMNLAVNELVTARAAIFASLPQQRDLIVQALARLDRIGQTRPMTAYFLNALGTIDETIYQSYRDRSNLEAAVLDHLRKAE